MSKFSERAAAALEQLPEDMQERAVAFILEEADKLEWLREQVDLGIADADAGRTVAWDPDYFLGLIETETKSAVRG